MRTLLVLLLSAGVAFGAFTDFYVQTTGSNLNAGSTSDNAAVYSYANGSWVAATGVFTVASGNPSSDGVTAGMFASVYTTSGATQTGFVGRITNVTTTTVTVSLSAKSGTAPVDGTTNTTLKVGGAWAGPNNAVAFPFGFVASTMTDASSNPVRVNFKTATYAVTAGISHANSDVYFEGYSTTIGDNAARATIQGPSTGSAFTLVTANIADNLVFENFIFENNGNSGSTSNYLLAVGTGSMVRNCIGRNAWGHGLYNDDDAIFIECEGYNNGLGGGADTQAGINMNYSGSLSVRCYSHNNNRSGFKADGGVLVYRGIAANNARAGLASTGDENQFCYSSDFYANGSSGVHLGLGSEQTMNTNYWNSNFIANTRYGFESEGQATPGTFFHNTNGAGSLANSIGEFEHDQWAIFLNNSTTTATPYQDATTDNFNIVGINSSESGYAVWTQIHPSYSGTVGVIDRGAAQQ